VIRTYQNVSRKASRQRGWVSASLRRPTAAIASAHNKNDDNNNNLVAVRSFAKKSFGGRLDDDDPNNMDMDINPVPKRSFSAADMEFFNNLELDPDYDIDDGGDDDDSPEEMEKKEEEAYRRRQEEIQRELDTRTGRTWTDPWQITDEDWMATTKPEDVPVWSPEFVSRISQERVKVHPGR
jgi:hypothetical protein